MHLQMDTPITPVLVRGWLRSRCQHRIRCARGNLGKRLVRENGEGAGEAGKAIKLVHSPFVKDDRRKDARVLGCYAALGNFSKADGEFSSQHCWLEEENSKPGGPVQYFCQSQSLARSSPWHALPGPDWPDGCQSSETSGALGQATLVSSLSEVHFSWLPHTSISTHPNWIHLSQLLNLLVLYSLSS